MIRSRPDIAFEISRLSQYMENPTVGLWTCMETVFGFIRRASTHRTSFDRQNCVMSPEGYCNADWAGCKASQNSTSGYMFLAGAGADLLKSKK